MQNAKCKMKEGLTPLLRFALFDLMQNAERRTKNAECRTQNGLRICFSSEFRIPNSEFRNCPSASAFEVCRKAF